MLQLGEHRGWSIGYLACLEGTSQHERLARTYCRHPPLLLSPPYSLKPSASPSPAGLEEAELKDSRGEKVPKNGKAENSKEVVAGLYVRVYLFTVGVENPIQKDWGEAQHHGGSDAAALLGGVSHCHGRARARGRGRRRRIRGLAGSCRGGLSCRAQGLRHRAQRLGHGGSRLLRYCRPCGQEGQKRSGGVPPSAPGAPRATDPRISASAHLQAPGPGQQGHGASAGGEAHPARL